jgi:hypothetical protein
MVVMKLLLKIALSAQSVPSTDDLKEPSIVDIWPSGRSAGMVAYYLMPPVSDLGRSVGMRQARQNPLCEA